ncbi:MAG: response regulator [Thermoguttaceae bacterium]|jgi:FixJ family two-component response regulator
MAEKPTVFVVDDDAGALRSLCWLLEQEDLPVRAFQSGREFLDAYCAEEPGCLVLDVRMPGMNGLEVQQGLRERGIHLPILFLTAHGDVATCAQAFRSGACDFLEKPVDDGVLLDHVHEALARDQRQRAQGPAVEFAARMSQLTPKEKDVLDMLIAGKSLKEIAIASGVTVQTVWRHRFAVLQKMGVENDVELVRLAMPWASERHS